MRDEIRMSHCPLTGIQITGGKAQYEHFRERGYYYRLEYEGESYYLGLCTALYDLIYANESDIERKGLKAERKEFTESLGIFFGELAKNNFKDLFDRLVHWSCNHPNMKADKNIVIKDVVQKVKEAGNYPKSRKEKSNIIINAIQENQDYDGQSVSMIGKFEFWSKFYLSSNSEFEFYLKELIGQGLIVRESNLVNLTFKGLDYAEGLEVSKNSINEEEEMYEIGLSFAGENRDYVEDVAQNLKNLGVKVFYDNYEQVDLWGKDLYQHLNNIYKNKCQYCIIFISDHYAQKLWTRHELKSAQSRAFMENSEYILPVRFDNTEIPGLNETVGYIDGRSTLPSELARMAMAKLGK